MGTERTKSFIRDPSSGVDQDEFLDVLHNIKSEPDLCPQDSSWSSNVLQEDSSLPNCNRMQVEIKDQDFSTLNEFLEFLSNIRVEPGLTCEDYAVEWKSLCSKDQSVNHQPKKLKNKKEKVDRFLEYIEGRDGFRNIREATDAVQRGYFAWFRTHILAEMPKLKECPFCKRCFWQQQTYHSHLSVHMGEKPYSCNACSVGFATYSKCLCQKHKLNNVALAAEKPQKKYHQCALCELSFTNQSGLADHLLSHVKLKQFICEICQESFQDERTYETHKMSHNINIKDRVWGNLEAKAENSPTSPCIESTSIELKEEIEIEDNLEFKSTSVDDAIKVFNNSANSVTKMPSVHIVSEPQESLTMSSSSTKQMKTPCELQEMDIGERNINVHETEIVKKLPSTDNSSDCALMEVETESCHSDSLLYTLGRKRKYPISIGYTQKPIQKSFGCPMCDQFFTEKYNLEEHIRSHSGESPYQCRICLKSYAGGDLLNHMRTHSLQTGLGPEEITKELMVGGGGEETNIDRDYLDILCHEPETIFDELEVDDPDPSTKKLDSVEVPGIIQGIISVHRQGSLRGSKLTKFGEEMDTACLKEVSLSDHEPSRRNDKEIASHDLPNINESRDWTNMVGQSSSSEEATMQQLPCAPVVASSSRLDQDPALRNQDVGDTFKVVTTSRTWRKSNMSNMCYEDPCTTKWCCEYCEKQWFSGNLCMPRIMHHNCSCNLMDVPQTIIDGPECPLCGNGLYDHPQKPDNKLMSYCCRYCNDIHSSRKALMTHSLSHTCKTFSGRTVCKLCCKHYNDIPDLIEHMKSHAAGFVKPLSCQFKISQSRRTYGRRLTNNPTVPNQTNSKAECLWINSDTKKHDLKS